MNEALKVLTALEDKVCGDSFVSILTGIGEEMCKAALKAKTYKDVTGFLTSSIGYGVFIVGRLVKVGGLKGAGIYAGKEFLQSMSPYIGERPAVVLVAAAPYALYVERKGYVVLDGARLNANGIVEHGISTLQL